MRVIKFLISALLLIGVVGGGGFFIGRELLLQIGISQIKADLNTIRRSVQNAGVYRQECRQKGASGIGGTEISSVHIRFIDANEYVVEVVCARFTFDPILVKTTTLPPFVTKEPGSSGLVWQDEPTAITLSMYGRTRSIGVDRTDIVEGLTPAEISITRQPVTSCQGYGYTCCQMDLGQGQGELIDTATDCPKSCYTSCEVRPVILSVTSQPFYDQTTRTLTVEAGQLIQIGFVMDPQGLENVTTVIDFGDGTSEPFTGINATASHTYECATGNCQYQLSVQATTPTGATSALTPLSKLVIVVN